MANPLFTIFKKYPELVFAFSQKSDGPMSSKKLFFQNRQDKIIVKNREEFFKKNEINPLSAVSCQQVHGNRIKIVFEKDAGKIIKRTDGLITKEKNLFLTIAVADCLPVFIYDPVKKIIGIVHCGWRGLAKNIFKKTLKILTKNFKSKPQDILVGIGPGISCCHFEVKKDLLERFPKIPERFIIRKQNKFFLDLKGLAKNHLAEIGLKEKNIEISPDCTCCLPEKYFSYRRQKPVPEHSATQSARPSTQRVERSGPKTMIAIVGVRSIIKDKG